MGKFIFYLRLFLRFFPFVLIVLIITSILQQSFGFRYTPAVVAIILTVIFIVLFVLFKRLKKIVNLTGQEHLKSRIGGQNISEFYRNFLENIFESRATKREFKYVLTTLAVITVLIVVYFKTHFEFLNPTYYFRYFLFFALGILWIYALYYNIFKAGRCSQCHKKINNITIDYDSRSVICPFCHAKTEIGYFFNIYGKYRYFNKLLNSDEITEEEKEKIRTKIL